MENKEQLEDNNIIIFKSVSTVDKYNFYEYLSVMIEWWISITKALESVESKIASPYFKKQIRLLLVFLKSWDLLSKAMKKIPDVFTKLEVSIIEAWESSGNLSLSLLKLSDNLRKKHELRSKIKSVLTYPTIIIIFLFLALFVVLTYVVPEIKQLFDTSEWVELPLSTQILVWLSDFVVNNTWLLFLGLATIIVFVIWFISTEKWRESYEEFVFGLPIVWRLYKNYILANIASGISDLIWSWVWVIKTLSLVWKSTNSIIYETMFNRVIQRVMDWEQVVKSIETVDEEKDYFPSDYTQMLSVWEKTASFDTIGTKLSKQYHKEVEYSLSSLTKFIEPVAIGIAWVFVLWFAYSIIWAILKITQTVW